jgi:hypothetical protein
MGLRGTGFEGGPTLAEMGRSSAAPLLARLAVLRIEALTFLVGRILSASESGRRGWAKGCWKR